MIRQPTQRKASQWQRLLQLLDSWRAKRVLGVLPTNVNYVWHFLVLFFDAFFLIFLAHVTHFGTFESKDYETTRIWPPCHSIAFSSSFYPTRPPKRAIAKVRPFRPQKILGQRGPKFDGEKWRVEMLKNGWKMVEKLIKTGTSPEKMGVHKTFADPQPSISPERSVLQLAWRHAVGNIGRRPITCRDRGQI